MSKGVKWAWRYADRRNKTVAGLDGGEFASAGDAETWLGENWKSLVDGGASYAELTEDGTARVTYSLPLPEGET